MRGPIVIEIEEGKIVQLLQHHVAWIVENVGARMIVDGGEKALEGRAVVQVFAGMQFEAGVDAGLVEGVQNRQPAARSSAKASSIRPAGRCGQG